MHRWQESTRLFETSLPCHPFSARFSWSRPCIETARAAPPPTKLGTPLPLTHYQYGTVRCRPGLDRAGTARAGLPAGYRPLIHRSVPHGSAPNRTHPYDWLRVHGRRWYVCIFTKKSPASDELQARTDWTVCLFLFGMFT